MSEIYSFLLYMARGVMSFVEKTSRLKKKFPFIFLHLKDNDIHVITAP